MEEIKQIPKPKSEDFRLEEIHNINFKPHPFMIGVKFVAHASDHFGGMLGTAAIKDYEDKHGVACENRNRDGTKCSVKYEEHKSDKVLFIKVLADKPIKEMDGLQKYLVSIKSKLEKLNIDGVAFIEPDSKD